MSDYDPTADPRYVPGVLDMPEDERNMLEEQAGEIEANIKAFDTVLLMFQHPGWDIMYQGFVNLGDELDVILKKTQDPMEWKFYRGQLAQVEWFKDFPDQMAKQQLRLRRDHAQIMRLLGKE